MYVLKAINLYPLLLYQQARGTVFRDRGVRRLQINGSSNNNNFIATIVGTTIVGTTTIAGTTIVGKIVGTTMIVGTTEQATVPMREIENDYTASGIVDTQCISSLLFFVLFP
eukprot:jgi/Psemu1/315871/fgenesh1_kg.2495_\